MRDLYQPAMLENWIVKRVSGPISDAEVRVQIKLNGQRLSGYL